MHFQNKTRIREEMKKKVLSGKKRSVAEQYCQAYSSHPIPLGFSIIMVKPYVKAVTHSEKLEWWIILMVDCVTILH